MTLCIFHDKVSFMILLDGKKLRDLTADRLKTEIADGLTESAAPQPQLAILQIGELAESNSYIAQKKLFVYNDHGKRDPFLELVSPEGVVMAYESDFTIADLILEGIMSGKNGEGIAIINGQVVQKGSRVGQFEVEAVMSNKVILRKGQEQFVVQLKKEE